MKRTSPLDPEPLWYLKALPYGIYRTSHHWRLRRDAYIESRRSQGELACEHCGLVHIDEAAVQYTFYVDAFGRECSGRKKDAQQVTTERYEFRAPAFHVHHLSYDNIGEETDEDLMLVCAPCHNAIHAPDSHAARWWTEYRLQHLETAEHPRPEPIGITEAWYDEIALEPAELD